MKNSLTKEEQKTISSYDKNAKQWAEEHATEGFWAEELEHFKKYLPKGKILEIGSGGGRDAKLLANAGYEYVGTDVSKGFVEYTKKTLPHLEFAQKSVYDLDFPKGSFDGFWASAVLLHIPRNKIDSALKSIKGAVKKGGIGLITMKQGTGEKLVGEKDKRLFIYYPQEEFSKILERNGFEILETHTKPMSEKTTWLVFIVRN